jgi:hypothetical protein
MLSTAAGIGQGLPQARYVIWSQGAPIAWYVNDSTSEGWVLPAGTTTPMSEHQDKVGAALELVGDHPDVKAAYADPLEDV